MSQVDANGIPLDAGRPALRAELARERERTEQLQRIVAGLVRLAVEGAAEGSANAYGTTVTVPAELFERPGFVHAELGEDGSLSIAVREDGDAEAVPAGEQDADARRRRVEAALGGGQVICDRCDATLATYADQCAADLGERCPGFEAIEKAGR